MVQFGEDGKIQKILRIKNFYLTHSTQISSSYNCFNKVKSKKIINKFKILTPSAQRLLRVKDIDINIFK